MAKIYRKFEYPDDVAKILNYLNEHGIVMCTQATIVNLYRQFSDEYYDAQWMNPNLKVLDEFSNWLADYEW